MIREKMYRKIQNFKRQGYFKTEIITVLGKDPKTVAKYYALDERLRTYRKVPELPFRRQMQLDFGQYRRRSGLKLFIFVAVLSASRYKYVIF